MSSNKQLPSVEYLRQVLDYNSETGKIFWKVNKGQRAKAGNELTYKNLNGYILIGIDKKQFMGHIIAWCIYYGEHPSFEIDHIDGNPANNKIINLRKANRSIQNMNKKISRNNTSGYKGVSYKKEFSMWVARIGINKKYIHLGYYNTAEEAYKSYCDAAKKYHGEYARLK